MFNVVQDFKFLLNKTPAYFIYWVTQGCNFTCDHCFNYIENKKENFDLSLEEIQRFSSHLNHLKYVTLAGGEPMIRKDLAQIVEIFYTNNGLQIINVVTNGWFTERTVDFAKRLLQTCPGLTISINVSIDGLREVHDFIRQKKGSFERCVATLGTLQELAKEPEGERLSLSATGTYNAANANQFLDTATYITHHVGVPYFMNLIRGEDVQNNSLKKIDIKHYRNVAHQLYLMNKDTFSNHYPYRGVKLAVTQTLTDVIYDSFKNNKMSVSCKAGKRGFVLTANGEILLCEVLNIRLGNIRQHDYEPMQILNSPKAIEEMRKIVDNQCHCTWECFQSMNIVTSPSMYPKVARHLLTNLLYKNHQHPNPDIPPPNPQKTTFRSHPLADPANFAHVG